MPGGPAGKRREAPGVCAARMISNCLTVICKVLLRRFSRVAAQIGDQVRPVHVDGLFLHVQASVVGNSTFAEFASASADPFIFVDPAFPNARLYDIVVSPGVGNAASVAAVPEPAAWALLMVGLTAMAMAALRRRPLHALSAPVSRRELSQRRDSISLR